MADSHIDPCVVWLTGLSGSGKSTIVHYLEKKLKAHGLDYECLDGDSVRSVFPATGFTRKERDDHVRRIGFVASLLEKHGVIVLVSVIAPFLEARDSVRRMCRKYVEVYVSTPLVECERRDVKGLYARARRGEIEHFTGINDPYEPPQNPELKIDTTGQTVSQAGDLLWNYLLGMTSGQKASRARRAR